MQSRPRIEAQLQSQPGQTTHSIARALRLSDSTVRQYLYDMVLAGVVERRRDHSVSSPRGDGAAVWRWLDPPLPAPPITDLLLCRICREQEYGDELRYLGLALSGETKDRLEAVFEDEVPTRCDGCTGWLLEPLEDEAESLHGSQPTV